MTEPNAVIRFRPPGPVAEAFMKSKKPFRIIRGPLGSGKTTATAIQVFKYICEQTASKAKVRTSRWVVVRNTYADLTNTTIRDWLSIVPDGAGVMTMGKPPEMKLDFDLPDGTTVKSEVIFLALDRPDDVRKLRGMQLTGAWVNEAKEIPKAIFDMLTGRIDRYPKPGYSSWVGVIGDTNAWDQDHPLEEWAEKIRQGDMPDYEFFVQPGAVRWVDVKWEVNPDAENLKVLHPEYYLRQIAGKKLDWIKVNLANEIGFSFDGKPVHPDYSDSMHCSPTILTPRARLVRVGFDWGLTPAAAFLQRQEDGQWWQFDEIVTDDASTEELAVLVKNRIADWNARVPGLTWMFRGDPAGDKRQDGDKSTNFTIMRMNDIPAFPASTNDPVIRRDALDRPLTRLIGGKPGFLISPNCTITRKGLSGAFCYKRMQIAGEDRFRDVPDKTIESHICEAVEYALMDGGEHAVINAPMRTAPPVRQQAAQKPDWSPFDV